MKLAVLGAVLLAAALALMLRDGVTFGPVRAKAHLRSECGR